jgi:hypothetical protein
MCSRGQRQHGDFSLHPKSSEKASVSLPWVASGVPPFCKTKIQAK